MKRVIVLENHPNDSRVKIHEDGICQTLSSRMGTGGGNVPLVLESKIMKEVYNISSFDSNAMKSSNPHSGIGKAYTSRTLDLNGGNPACNQGGLMIIETEEKTNMDVVRRLTPLECERLQGFPDHWTDIGEWVDSKGKKHKDADSPRYKALGNSIALPQHYWYIQKMQMFLPEGATLGSLFDGIGGFPLCWEDTYGKGTAKWASEIEEFPIAVTKLRFPNE